MGQPKIGTRLGVGFSVGVFFTLLVGLVVVTSNNTLINLAEALHRHPFSVTNAVLEAKGDLFEVRSTVKDLIFAADPAAAEPTIERIRALEASIDVQLGTIRERYLGPRADVDRMMADYGMLRAHRDAVITLVRAGSIVEARARSLEEGPPMFRAVRADMDTIKDFAERKAANFIEKSRATRDRIQMLTWVMVVGALMASMGTAWAITRSITVPLATLRGCMAKLSAGDLTVAVPAVERRDEIGEMARAVQVFKDGLTHAESLEQALRQSQKMEAIGQMTGGIAHDFNNLLQVILSNLDLLMRRLGGEPAAARYLHNAIAGAEQGAKLTSQLLAFARRQPLAPKPLRVDRLVGDMTAMLRRTMGERIDIETVNSGGLWTALVDRNQLQNAILNLVINARDAMPDGGKLTIEVANSSLDAAYAASHAEVKAGQYVMLAVTDTGVGMGPEIVEKVFEPFFTTKPEGVGTGLGLSMVFGFVKQSGGHVKIYSEVGLGTTVKLYLPRTDQDEASRVAEESRAARGNGETILVAEDDDSVRAAVVTQLAELGYRVLAASDGEMALEILGRGERVDLLFTDVVMPGPVNGRALADHAKQRYPDLHVVFTSGYTENAIIHHGRLDEGVTLLSKPYRQAELAETIRAALGRPAEAVAPPPKRILAAAPAFSAGDPARRPGDGVHPILVAEDDDGVRSAMIDILEQLGHEVLATACPEEALRQLGSGGDVRVLITDVNLPGMDGITLAREALTRYPALAVIIATGRSLDPENLPDPSIAVLPKPFCIPDLKKALDKALAQQMAAGS